MNANHSFFKNIDNEEKAYWLGFLTGDGHISNYEINLELEKKDKKHIEKFLNVLNCNANLGYRERERETGYISKSYYTSIYSRLLVQDLRKLGLKKRKTYTVQFPEKFIKTELQRHYWRGLIDADGSIQITENYYVIGLWGNKFIASSFLNFLINNKIATFSKIYKDKRSDVYRTQITGLEMVYQVVKLLYYDCSIYLDRKMKLAREIMKSFLVCEYFQQLM